MENGDDITTALAIFDAADDAAIVEAVGPHITGTWVYSFPGQEGGIITGLSIVGVENAARECAKRGEAIREIETRMERDSEREAYFIAKAGRYLITGEGQEVLLNVAIRGCRVSKWIRLRPEKAQQKGVKEVFDEKWSEKGIAKAARNAVGALLPEEVKAFIIEEAGRQGLIGDPRDRQPQQQQARPRTTPPPKPSPAQREAAGEPMMSTVDHLIAAARAIGYKDEGEVLAALGLTNRMEIPDVQSAFGKLRELAIAKKAGNGGR